MKKFFQSKGFIVTSLTVLQPGLHRRFQAGRIPAQQHDQRLVGWRYTDRW